MLENKYDIVIVGGGLAGLSLSIQLSKKGHRVALMEKEAYPFHKVCGEYISMESWPFLEQLGMPLSSLRLPIISTLQLTAPNGNAFTTKLPLGGFGLSRFALDKMLAGIAIQSGVTIMEKTKVTDIVPETDCFFIHYLSGGINKTAEASVCCCAYGKRSNLDIKWKRSFVAQQNLKVNNYVAVKYHVTLHWPEHLIGLHNFKGGYCGVSRVEDNKCCLCYLTTSNNLRKNNNSISEMEKKVLCQNPHLKKIFSEAQVLHEFPITISQISFEKKTLVENGMLMIGDAAGMITPLCGNGMSMALYAGKIAADCIHEFLSGKCKRKEMEAAYVKQWKTAFESRMKMGRLLQRFFGTKTASNLFVAVFKTWPFLAGGVIKKTHGQPF